MSAVRFSELRYWRFESSRNATPHQPVNLAAFSKCEYKATRRNIPEGLNLQVQSSSYEVRSAFSKKFINNFITLTLNVTLAKMKVSIRNSGLNFTSL
jgi:hypothetical protein